MIIEKRKIKFSQYLIHVLVHEELELIPECIWQSAVTDPGQVHSYICTTGTVIMNAHFG